jgi:hypothetical protein
LFFAKALKQLPETLVPAPLRTLSTPLAYSAQKLRWGFTTSLTSLVLKYIEVPDSGDSETKAVKTVKQRQ